MTKSWTKGHEMDNAEKMLEQDYNQVLATFRGIFVLPIGLELIVEETSGSPNDYVQISTGQAWIEDTLGEITSTQQVQISGAASGYERYDAIYINSGTNTVGKITGTEVTSNAKPPDIPEDKCILAFVFVNQTGTPVITNSLITDRRFFGYFVESDLIGIDEIAEENIAFDNSAGHDHDGTDSKTVDHVDLASKGTNTHAQIDTAITSSTNHIASSANPHSVDNTDVLPNSADAYVVVDVITLGYDIVSRALTSYGDYNSPNIEWTYFTALYPDHDPADFIFFFVGAHKTSNALYTSSTRLYNITDTLEVSGSLDTTTSINGERFRKEITIANGKKYKAQHKIANIAGTSYLEEAKIIICIALD